MSVTTPPLRTMMIQAVPRVQTVAPDPDNRIFQVPDDE